MRSRSSSQTDPRARLARFFGALVLAVVALGGAAALAATGALVPKGCIADPLDNPAACGETAQGLESVSSIAVSADGKSLYAAGLLDNALAVFKRDPSTGALTPAGCIGDAADNSAGCAQTAVGLGLVHLVAASGDGRSVYAAGEWAAGRDAIVRFSRNTASGALTPQGCVAEPTKAPTGCAKAKGLREVRSIAISANGRSLYAAGANKEGGGVIVAFIRITASGALRAQGCVAASPASNNPEHCAGTVRQLKRIESIAVSADGRSVYTAGKGLRLGLFRRDRTNGELTPMGCIGAPEQSPRHLCAQSANGLQELESVVISADGRSVYTAGSLAITRFKRSRISGALTPRGCISDPASPFPPGCPQSAKGIRRAASLALSADGKSLYSGGPFGIARLGRNTTSGALEPQGCIADPAQNPDHCSQAVDAVLDVESIALSANGRSLYAASPESSAIVRFERRP
jgi:6-phosphogluconolactonase (cycloisomerase 2 family)